MDGTEKHLSNSTNHSQVITFVHRYLIPCIIAAATVYYYKIWRKKFSKEDEYEDNPALRPTNAPIWAVLPSKSNILRNV